MKFLLSWLKEYTEISLHPQTLADRLTLAGLEVTSLSPVDGDWLFEAEVTPNRPDLLSHLGIARETAAVLGRPFRFPRWLEKEMRLPRQAGAASVPVTLEDGEACRRYVGIVIEGVKVGASPPEPARRLTRLGLRPVNNVVDVTNWVLHELGQPLHAFDLDRLEGPAVRVRRAKAGEKLTTLDGIERALTPDLLVIADAKRPVALAGIMGGRSTEITASTRRVFLESAWFDPRTIRRATRLSKVWTDSSYRFERGVEWGMVQQAAARAARMIVKYAGGELSGEIDQASGHRPAHHRISLKSRTAQEVLGVRSSPAQQKRFLEHLGCRVTGTGKRWRVEPPPWRSDLKIPEDLYEELARLWGYDRCPPTLPGQPRRPLEISAQRPANKEDPIVSQEAEIRAFLVGAGAQEILTYSLLSPEVLARCRMDRPEPLKIRNPLSIEQACLRPSLLPGALDALSRNLRRKSGSAFLFFELGRVFDPSVPAAAKKPQRLREPHPGEKRALALLAAGTPEPAWGAKEGPLGLFHVKGILQELSVRLGMGPLTESIEPGPLGAASIVLKKGRDEIGFMGAVEPELLARFEAEGISGAYAEINLDRLARSIPPPLRVRDLPKVPPVTRDMALVLPEQVPYQQVSEAINEAGRPLLAQARLFDLYKGKQVPPGKKSMAFRLAYSAGDRTLTEEEVTAAHQEIIQHLSARFQATLR
ncbi:MAG: phenylalanine--tRNA ligase subunit beta [Candidatus Omnitrophica bacterium]|nr:phenylalanine--tRNA ligase subunit beta [Candidatus Omnitrophota bacterium]